MPRQSALGRTAWRCGAFSSPKCPPPLPRGLRAFGGTAVPRSESMVVSEVSDDGKFATVTLNRPEVHNALHPDLISQLSSTFRGLADQESELRAVFLCAEGKTFCAGGDLKHMRSTGDYTHDENEAEAMVLSGLFEDIRSFPRPVIALVGGPCYGGGVGIISSCDMAFALPSCRFVLSEVKLGVIPATISPYVIDRIGSAAASRYFLTAEIFGSDKAKSIGLLHDVVSDLGEIRCSLEQSLSLCSPRALGWSKDLIANVANKPITEDLRSWTATKLADVRESADGKEGMSAFIEKRKPSWVVQ